MGKPKVMKKLAFCRTGCLICQRQSISSIAFTLMDGTMELLGTVPRSTVCSSSQFSIVDTTSGGKIKKSITRSVVKKSFYFEPHVMFE